LGLLSSLSWRWWDKKSEMDILNEVYNEEESDKKHKERFDKYIVDNKKNIRNIDFIDEEKNKINNYLEIMRWKIKKLKNILISLKSNSEVVYEIDSIIKNIYLQMSYIKNMLNTGKQTWWYWTFYWKFVEKNDLIEGLRNTNIELKIKI